MELETLGFSSVQEPNNVVRISDGAENIVLLPGRIVGNDTSLQLGELMGSSANPNEDRGLFLLVRVLQDSADATLAVFERRLEADKRVRRVSDSKLFDDVAGLKHVSGPLVGFGTSLETLYG